MKIKNIQVDEGFLDKLNLSFADGLNVIIGPRGVGKTSIVELIRFCLGVEAYSDRGEKARNHALSVLGTGQVTLTLEENGEEFTISKTAEIEPPTVPLNLSLPIILSQGEIETIGLKEEGKLRLIDNFIAQPSKKRTNEISTMSEINSFSSQIQSLNEEVWEINIEVLKLIGVKEELKNAKKDQEKYSGTIEKIKPQQKQLAELADFSTQLSVEKDVVDRTIDSLSSWAASLDNVLVDKPLIEAWPTSAGDVDLLKSIRKTYSDAVTSLEKQQSIVLESIESARGINEKIAKQKKEAESKARALRLQIDQVQEGAGAVARRVAELKEKVGTLEALKQLSIDKQSVIVKLKRERGSLLDKLDELRLARFNERTATANKLNNELSPFIEVKIIRAAQLASYESAIIETLRGSGIKYNSLAPQLAKSISPRELGEAIEDEDFSVLAGLTGMSDEKAAKVLAVAQSVGVKNIMTSFVEDGAQLSLFVGNEYQPSERLSTGQRCTVVLPIILSNHGKMLVIDQPEDNLDNGYIVETVIKSLRNAANSTQIICTTHNPNIPVLGEADLVISLNSDGKRGFVKSAKPLDHQHSVEAITTVMEGGKDAFLRRAKFYDKQRVKNG